jgi:formate dehydrogenase major subunit
VAHTALHEKLGVSERSFKMATKTTRRDFLKQSGLLAAGTAAGSLAALGVDLGSRRAMATELRIRNTQTYPSICPYCAVGCGTLIHVEEGRIVNIEGNPESPVNVGTLCPKGAATFQLHVNPNRITHVLHREPGATDWEVWDLDRAMDRIAELVKETRDETFVEEWTGPDDDGVEVTKTVNYTPAIFSLGGATMANEWNHIHQKLMRGLGVVAIENQARI